MNKDQLKELFNSIHSIECMAAEMALADHPHEAPTPRELFARCQEPLLLIKEMGVLK